MQALRQLVAGVIAAPLLCGSPGCDRGTQPSTNAVAPAPGPKTVFFDGMRVLPPTEWAGLPPAEVAEADASLLPSLRIREIVRKSNATAGWEGGLNNPPEMNPAPDFLADIETLKSLGRAERIPLRWVAAQRGWGDDDLTNIALPDGGDMSGGKISAYFNTLHRILGEGGLPSLEADHALSAPLLRIGYALYRSDTSLANERLRIMQLGAAWRTAFALREQAATAAGNAPEAERWKARSRELDDVTRHMLKENLRKRGS